jgi:IS5 family transposase
MSQASFFDCEYQLDKINPINDFLRRLDELIDWSIFLDLLTQARPSEKKSNADRPAFDVLLMFKILILKTVYNLSDDQVELQIRDRLSFRAFLGLSFSDTVPDSKTIWLFSEQLTQLGLGKLLFDRFYSELENYGVTIKGGIAVDGTFVEVPKQHFHQDEYAQIKKGEKPESRTSKPAVQSQTDFDARYTRKNNEKHDGYKNHVEADVDAKMITDYEVTSASVHDSVPFLELLPKEAKKEEQKANNKLKSKIRCRIEHIFGAQKMRMGKVMRY